MSVYTNLALYERIVALIVKLRFTTRFINASHIKSLPVPIANVVSVTRGMVVTLYLRPVDATLAHIRRVHEVHASEPFFRQHVLHSD